MIDLATPTALVADLIVNDPALADNACILGARALVEVLSYHGVSARAVPVVVLAGNHRAARLTADEVPVEQWPADAWTLGVHPDHPMAVDRPNGWNGHLVVESHGVLLDPTSGQMARPKRQMAIPNHLVLEWPDPAAPASWVGQDGSWVIYTRHPMPLPTRARDWRANYKRVAAVAIREMRRRESHERLYG